MLITVLLSVADASPIVSAELRHTAETLDPGVWSIRPLMPAGFGVTDRIEVKVPSVVGLVQSPYAGVEVALLDTAQHDLSAELGGSTAYGQVYWEARFTLGYTATLGRSSFSISPEISHVWHDEGTSVWANVFGFYDFRVNEYHGLRVRATTRPQTWGSGVPAGSAAIAWVGGTGSVRAQVGVGFAYGQDLIELSNWLEGFIDIPKVMPYPDVALWWTF